MIQNTHYARAIKSIIINTKSYLDKTHFQHVLTLLKY